jgi:hypothetical protein
LGKADIAGKNTGLMTMVILVPQLLILRPVAVGWRLMLWLVVVCRLSIPLVPGTRTLWRMISVRRIMRLGCAVPVKLRDKTKRRKVARSRVVVVLDRAAVATVPNRQGGSLVPVDVLPLVLKLLILILPRCLGILAALVLTSGLASSEIGFWDWRTLRSHLGLLNRRIVVLVRVEYDKARFILKPRARCPSPRVGFRYLPRKEHIRKNRCAVKGVFLPIDIPKAGDVTKGINVLPNWLLVSR